MRHSGSVKNGIVFIFVITIVLQAIAGMAAESSVAQGELSALQSQLEQHGWKVERSATGDLLLWPPGEASSEQPLQVKAADTGRIPATDLGSLQQALKEKGWQVSQDQKGDLLVYPSGAASVAESTADVEQDADRLDDLRALLSASGWKVDKRAQGDLILYPASPVVTATPKEEVLRIEQTDVVGIKKALNNAGWRAEQRNDGSLILYPRSDSSPPPVAEQRDPVSTGKVKLPVDSWKEARLIARHWVSEQTDRGLSLGKIRKVNWIYLVSIVEKSPPYRLKNQLAIRSKDGSVVSIF